MRKVIGLSLLGVLMWSTSVVAGVREGINFFDNQQWQQALAEFKPLADQGERQSQYYTAYLYLNGFGVPKDEQLGLSYLKKSADQEFDKALTMMGYFSSEGILLPRDKKLALEYYEKAVESNENDALLNLGVMYYNGDGVPQDIDKATEYFERVDKTKRPIAGRYLGDLYLVNPDATKQKKASGLYIAAAQSGDIVAYHALGDLYRKGTGTKKDATEAFRYYEYAASEGYGPSQYALGLMYANGEGAPEKDLIKAYAWLALATRQGVTVAAQAQREVESLMTFSELGLARQEVITLQRDFVGNVESPLKELKSSSALGPGEADSRKTQKKTARGGRGGGHRRSGKGKKED